MPTGGQVKRVLIVDDEEAARLQLRRVIEGMPELKMVAELSNGTQAIKSIAEYKPDIVFLDIDMPEVNGFEVASKTQHLMYQLVFLTAHHQYALEAFNTHAIDYLLKPARPSVIEKCLRKVLRQEVLSLERTSLSKESTEFVLSDSGNCRFLNTDHVLFIEGLGRYRRIHLTSEGKSVHQRETILSDTTLEQFTETLDEGAFIRVHRSYLVNLPQIASLQTKGRGSHLYLAGRSSPIPVARSRLGLLKLALGVDP
ncbi:MAG: LytTR family DNA-binding domain-containing protein [Pseudomonadota bacterium]